MAQRLVPESPVSTDRDRHTDRQAVLAVRGGNSCPIWGPRGLTDFLGPEAPTKAWERGGWVRDNLGFPGRWRQGRGKGGREGEAQKGLLTQSCSWSIAILELVPCEGSG